MRRAYRAASRAAPLATKAAARTCALNCICAVDENMYRVFRPTATSKCMKKRPSACSNSSRVRLCAPRWGEEGPIWLEFSQATRGLRRNAQDWPRVVESDARHGRYRNTFLHEGPEHLSLALVAVPERQWTHRPQRLRIGLRRGVEACVGPFVGVVTVS